MGTVKAFHVPGCRCWFWTGDHDAPHFHAGVRDEWEIRIYFLRDPVEYEIKWRVKHLSTRLVRELLELAAAYRTELLEQWEKSTADD